MEAASGIFRRGTTKWLTASLAIFPFLIVLWSACTAEGSCVVPTVPGSIPDIEKWVRSPILYVGSDTVRRGEEAQVWVDCGGWGSPPFIWHVEGTGFTLSKERTQRDQEINALTAGVSACGSAIITVTDSRGVPANGSVRCASSGIWVTKGYHCGFDQVVPASEYRYGQPYFYFTAYQGNKRVDMTVMHGGGGGTCNTPWQDFDTSYYCAEKSCYKFISRSKLDPTPCIDTSSLVPWSLCECYETTHWNCMYPKGLTYSEWECR